MEVELELDDADHKLELLAGAGNGFPFGTAELKPRVLTGFWTANVDTFS